MAENKRRYARHNGQFKSKEKHPRFRSDQEILAILNDMDLGHRRPTGTIKMDERSRRYASLYCTNCDMLHDVLVDNLLRGASSECRCLRGVKYDNPALADLLGERYDSMYQRCTNPSDSNFRNYGGRGITVKFNREEFIRWGLKKFTWPEVRDNQFDRINNDGNYTFRNLRLVSASVNAKNKRPRNEWGK